MEGRIVYSTNPTHQAMVDKRRRFRLQKSIRQAKQKYLSIEYAEDKTFALGGGEWSIEIYNSKGQMVKEFVGNNGCPNWANPDGHFDDLWEEVYAWNESLELKRKALLAKIHYLEELMRIEFPSKK